MRGYFGHPRILNDVRWMFCCFAAVTFFGRYDSPEVIVAGIAAMTVFVALSLLLACHAKIVMALRERASELATAKMANVEKSGEIAARLAAATPLGVVALDAALERDHRERAELDRQALRIDREMALSNLELAKVDANLWYALRVHRFGFSVVYTKF